MNNQAIHGGFRSIVMSDLSSSSFFPKFNLVVKYRKTIDSITNDVAVNDGNIILARELQLRPKISYDCNVGYFTLLLVDMDSPARAASDRRFCIHWALVNVCQSDKSAIKEVISFLNTLSRVRLSFDMNSFTIRILI